MADGNFDRMAALDAEHRARFGHDGYIVPGLPTRAEKLADAILSLDAITPALSRRYLIKGWLDRGAMSVLYGESNVGKTFLALDLAMHVAAGAAWDGARVVGGPVLYIASEGGRGIRNRIAALRLERPDLALAAGSRFMLLPEVVDLCRADGDAVLQVLADLPETPVLIVVDTLARAMGEGDENSGQDMGALIRTLDRIRAATGAHVMAVHHAGKDTTKGARGHSSLRAAVDTEVQVTRDGVVITAETRKQRDMDGARSLSYNLMSVDLGHDEDGDPVTSCVIRLTEPLPPAPPKLTGQPAIAMQALGDALARHGKVMPGDMFPQNRPVVSLHVWREYCGIHHVWDEEDEAGTKRNAFYRVKKNLHESAVICIVDGHVWRVSE